MGSAMSNEVPSNLSAMKQKIDQLLAEAKRCIRAGRIHAAKAKETRFRMAILLLTQAKEYVDASFSLLEEGNSRPSLTTTRWILEAALNLVWVTADSKHVDDRLKSWGAETFRLEAAKWESLIELYPDQTDQLNRQAKAARQQQKRLMEQQGCPKFGPLGSRLNSNSIREKLEAEAVPNLYSFYRKCCEASHPSAALWLQLKKAPGGAVVTQSLPDETQIACFILCASITWLVGGAYCLTELGDNKILQTWWKNEIAPLLATPD